jgi:zinc D-Ala-D-Ala carboxypeptidase
MPVTLTSPKLSSHFTLHELLASQTATRKNITEQFDPPQAIIENLKFLCVNLLEKLRILNGNNPLFLSSGYRCDRTNRAVGGAKNSQHIQGQAADVDFGSKKANKEFFDRIKNSDIPFDQLLNEFGFSWVHISINKEGNRHQVLDITSR